MPSSSILNPLGGLIGVAPDRSNTTASTYDPSLGGINGSPDSTPCGVPVRQLPWSVAHKTLPCGTIVMIVAQNGSQNPPVVQVPVADRGPYITGRDLDLRPAVAQALGSTGLLRVSYQPQPRGVNLHNLAAAGGDANAFKRITGLDPVLNASTVNQIGQNSGPGRGVDVQGAVVGAVDAAGNLISGAASWAAALTKVLSFIGSKGGITRSLKVAGGAILLIIAVDELMKVGTGSSPISAGKKVVKKVPIPV